MHLHPLAPFHYCPVCGAPGFAAESPRSKHCAACGFTLYANAAAATVAVIVRDGKMLVTRRAYEPAKGTLDLPGGFVDPGESVTEGVLREVEEETGIKGATVRDFLFSIPNEYPFSGLTVHTADLFFLIDIPADAQPQAADDAAALLWVPLRDLHPEDFGLHSIRKGIARLLLVDKLRVNK